MVISFVLAAAAFFCPPPADGAPVSEPAVSQCPVGHVAVPAPKQCFTTPCPQFDCVPILTQEQTEPVTPY